jgi:hypothetical protein
VVLEVVLLECVPVGWETVMFCQYVLYN